MAWTPQQIKTAAIAARAIGLPDEHRKLILYQFQNARFDRDGKASQTASSTSQCLTQSDFEHYMARLEGIAPAGAIPGWEPGHWAAKAEDDLRRMRGLAQRMHQGFSGRVPGWEDAGRAVAGWVRRMFPDAGHESLERLDYHGLKVLITAWRALRRRHHLPEVQ